MPKVSDLKLRTHQRQAEFENVDFLMPPEGGGLEVEQVAKRLGVGVDGLKKRLIYRSRL